MDSSDIIDRAVPEALLEIKCRWDEILACNNERSVFLSVDYLALWYRCFAKESEIFLLEICDNDETIGFWPLVRRVERGRTILSGLTNKHCLHFTPLIRRGSESSFLQRTMAALENVQWDIIQLDWLHSYLELCHPDLRSDGGRFKSICTSEKNYTINLSAEFEDYFNNDLSAKLRKNLKMYRNKLNKSGKAIFKHFTGREAIARFDEFLEVEDSGWKGAAGSSIVKSGERYKTYYRALIELLAKSDDLHLYFMELDGVVIAAVFGYSENEIFHYSKIGYREEFSKLSPSNLLLQDIIADIKCNLPNIKRFHLFPEGTGYKHRWTNEESHTYSLKYYSNSFHGQTAYLLAVSRKKLKEVAWLKKTVFAMRNLGKGK